MAEPVETHTRDAAMSKKVQGASIGLDLGILASAMGRGDTHAGPASKAGREPCHKLVCPDHGPHKRARLEWLVAQHHCHFIALSYHGLAGPGLTTMPSIVLMPARPPASSAAA